MLESAAVPHRACKADVHVLPSANFMQKAKCSQHKQTVVPTQDCAKHVFKTPTSHTELPLHAASHVPSDPLFPVTETRQRSRFFNESMKLCVSVHAHVCVCVHACVQVPWNPEVDLCWHALLRGVSDECEPEWCDSEDPLFILYTSGSTGKPKVRKHTCGSPASHLMRRPAQILCV